MSRAYPERPAVAVAAVVFSADGRHVLLIRRGRPPAQGTWALPGGGQKLGETVFAAAEREVREETGLAVTASEVLTAVDSLHRDGDGALAWHYTIIDVLAERVAGEPVAAADADAVAWAPLAELDAYALWDPIRRVIEQARPRAAARRG